MRSIILAGFAAGLLSNTPASAQSAAPRELTTAAAVKGVPASKPAPDMYFLVGESGAKETYTLTIKGPASLTLFTPDGHEMVSSTGSGAVTLVAVLNWTDVFTLAVSRADPQQPYTLIRRTTVPTLAEAELALEIGYVLKVSGGGTVSECWVTPGVKARSTDPKEMWEATLAADRATVTALGHRGSELRSYEKTYSLVGDSIKRTIHWPDGKIDERTGRFDAQHFMLRDDRTHEFGSYLCDD